MIEVTKPTMINYRRHVLVCVGAKCTQHGEGQALYEMLKKKLLTAGLNGGELRVQCSRVNCLGTCKSGPLLCVQPDGVWYYAIDNAKLDRIIKEHFQEGKPVAEWIYHQGPELIADNPK